jgi:hypothetical protein
VRRGSDEVPPAQRPLPPSDSSSSSSHRITPPPPPPSRPPPPPPSDYDTVVDYATLFKGIGDDDGETIAELLTNQLPAADWLEALQNAVFDIVQDDWNNWDAAIDANAHVFKKPLPDKEGVLNIKSNHSARALESLKRVLSVDRYLIPVEWREGEEDDVERNRIPQPYLNHPARVSWGQGKKGLNKLKSAMGKSGDAEVSKVGKRKRVMVRVVEEGWTTNKWKRALLPWVDPEKRKEAVALELLEQAVQEVRWCDELLPMKDHFNGREHLIIRTEGGMGTTSHLDGVGGWGYLSTGWKVVISFDPTERARVGWNSNEELLDLDLLANSVTVKWTLLGPGMSIWFTPDSHHAVITLCNSSYITWSATISPHRVILSLGLILNALLDDYTWVAMKSGKRNVSKVYVNVMEMLVYSWMTLSQSLERESRHALLVAASHEFRNMQQQLEELFGDATAVYHPIRNGALTQQQSARVRELYRTYADAMEAGAAKGGKDEVRR